MLALARQCCGIRYDEVCAGHRQWLALDKVYPFKYFADGGQANRVPNRRVGLVRARIGQWLNPGRPFTTSPRACNCGPRSSTSEAEFSGTAMATSGRPDLTLSPLQRSVESFPHRSKQCRLVRTPAPLVLAPQRRSRRCSQSRADNNRAGP